MKTQSLIAAFILATSASLAFADGTDDAKPDAQKQPAQPSMQTADADKANQPDQQRMVCKFEQPTGSLIKTRICKTAFEWQDEREHSRKMMEDLQARTAGPTHGN
jgi:hypothetical protein